MEVEKFSQNPFYVLGVWANASRKEIERSRRRFASLISVGKEVVQETDITVLGTPKRDEEKIQAAIAQLEQNESKFINGLFWFVNDNHLDKAALAYLGRGDVAKAHSIWEKAVLDRGITAKNISCLNNLGTLNLWLGRLNKKVDPGYLVEGLSEKAQLLEQKNIQLFKSYIVDDTYTIDAKDELVRFTNTVLDDETLKQILKVDNNFLDKLPSEIREITKKKASEGKATHIESQVKSIAAKRENEPDSGKEHAHSLYLNTRDELVGLKGLLGNDDMTYKMIADKLANEILQCGITLFNEFHEKEDSYSGDLGEDILSCFKMAKSVAVGKKVNDRIKENLDGVNAWIENSEDRRKNKRVEDEIDFITHTLESAERKTEKVDVAENLINDCKPKLHKIANKLGSNDEMYLNVSSTVAGMAMGIIITSVNDLQHRFSIAMEGVSAFTEEVAKVAVKDGVSSESEMVSWVQSQNGREHIIVENLKSEVKQGIVVLNQIADIKIHSELKSQVETNIKSIKSLANNLGVSIPRSTFGSSSSSSSTNSSNSTQSLNSYGGSKCYIATLAYGDINDPRVQEFRDFRDDVLAYHYIGRKFIDVYYQYSPSLVRRLAGAHRTQKIIKYLLDNIRKVIA